MLGPRLPQRKEVQRKPLPRKVQLPKRGKRRHLPKRTKKLQTENPFQEKSSCQKGEKE